MARNIIFWEMLSNCCLGSQIWLAVLKLMHLQGIPPLGHLIWTLVVCIVWWVVSIVWSSSAQEFQKFDRFHTMVLCISIAWQHITSHILWATTSFPLISMSSKVQLMVKWWLWCNFLPYIVWWFYLTFDKHSTYRWVLNRPVYYINRPLQIYLVSKLQIGSVVNKSVPYVV